MDPHLHHAIADAEFARCFYRLPPARLKIRPKFPPLRSFIPIESQPAQPVVNSARGFLRVARAIGILDPQDQRAPRVFGVEPVKQSRARTADMKISGGRWSEANANGRAHGRNGVVEQWSNVDFIARS